jgi:hypothetical protein
LVTLTLVPALAHGVGGARQEGRGGPEWTAVRDRWEYGHVLRAGLTAVSFLALVVALT